MPTPDSTAGASRGEASTPAVDLPTAEEWADAPLTLVVHPDGRSDLRVCENLDTATATRWLAVAAETLHRVRTTGS